MFKIIANQQDVGRPKAEVLMTAQRLIAVNARPSERGLKKNGTTFPSGVIVPWTSSRVSGSMVLPVFRTISFAGSLSKKNCRKVGNRTRTFDHWFAQLQLKVASL
jgi:hypothetical protein